MTQHKFGDYLTFKSVPANPLLGRYAQTERACKCGLVKITVHPPEGVTCPPRLYRWGNAREQLSIMPECPGMAPLKAEAAE